METLVFRVDAGSDIGTGHLMRCLALAQAWKARGGKAVFITSCRIEGLLTRLRDEDFVMYLLPRSAPDDWDDTQKILTGYSGVLVVLDGYLFDGDYQQRIKELGHRLLVIDDTAHLKHYYADIILNQNLGAEGLLYSCEPYTRLLLGTKYVLLRREFTSWSSSKREIPPTARHLLVTLGGADPVNLTLKVIRALQQVKIPDLEATVVIGGSNPNADILQAETVRGNVKMRLVRDAKNMPELMAWADVAVTAGGTTSWEIAFLGLPSLVLVFADNHAGIAKELDAAGAARNLGWGEGLDPDVICRALSKLIQSSRIREDMSRLGQSLVDGRGCTRVIKILEA